MASRVETGSRIHEFPDSSQRGDLFIGQTETLKFIDWAFTPGNLKIQETAADPVPAETQQQILRVLPEFLTEMVFRNIPINEPDDPEIPEEDPAHPKHPHITHSLRPDVINTPEGQADVNYATQAERNRQLREFGQRIWIKLTKKTLDEPKPPHAVHPLKELHGFNGMIVGLPTLPTYRSYREMILSNRNISNEEILTLMEYEAANGLLTDQDKAEIYSLLTKDQSFARTLIRMFERQGDLPILLSDVPLTWALIHSLQITNEGVVVILSYKLQNKLLDDYTAETIKEIVANPVNEEVIGYLECIVDELAGTPLGDVDLQLAKRREVIGAILQLPVFQEDPDDEDPDEPTNFH